LLESKAVDLRIPKTNFTGLPSVAELASFVHFNGVFSSSSSIIFYHSTTATGTGRIFIQLMHDAIVSHLHWARFGAKLMQGY